MKILIIEDDTSLTLALYRALGPNYALDTAQSAMSGIQKAETSSYDGILLDLNLPDMPGLKVCEHLRSLGIQTPILVISGEAKIISKVILLDSGANDYLTKPFSLDELRARLRAMLRNRDSSYCRSRMSIADLTLDSTNRKVERSGNPIELRRKEFDILEYLMQNAGIVVSRASLAAHIWSDESDTGLHTIDVHIKHLRDRVDRPFGRNLIKTVHGMGYRIELPPRTISKKH